MQATNDAHQYSSRKAQLIHSAFDLTSKFPGTDVLVLTLRASKETSYIYDFKTHRFAPMLTHPESKSLITKYLSAPDTESPDDNGTPEQDKADEGDTQDEVPKFKFKRQGNGSLAIVDKERYDLMFPQFKSHAMRRVSQIPGAEVLFLASCGPDLVAAFATPKWLPFLVQPEGWNMIKACLEQSTEMST
ncbi:hypothetical protein BGZ68_008042 [Mortierella alpina]|nr:hypothetical protein BGZ68_008042 [Mortierella alpina]